MARSWKPVPATAATLLALAASTALAAFAGTAVVPRGLPTIGLLAAAVALPGAVAWLFVRRFTDPLAPAAVLATIALSLMVSLGISDYLLDRRGETQTATVTAYVDAAAKGTAHYVRLAGPDGREYPEHFTVGEPLAIGTEVQIRVDPLGWAMPTPVGRDLGPWFWPLTAGGYLLVGGMYAAAIRRESRARR